MQSDFFAFYGGGNNQIAIDGIVKEVGCRRTTYSLKASSGPQPALPDSVRVVFADEGCPVKRIGSFENLESEVAIDAV